MTRRLTNLRTSYILTLALLAFTLGAGPEAQSGSQGGAETPKTAPTAPQPEAVIRSSVRLVQVSVVVADKKGNPVAGLKQEDFTLLDEGKPQKIAFFNEPARSVEHSSASPVRRLPPNVFTNRYDLKGEDAPGAVTVVLFDALNTARQDQAYVRKQVIRFLRELKPQDHVAVYGLTTQLFRLHEFTRDSADLVAAAEKFTPRELAAYDSTHTPDIDLVSLGADPQWTNLQNSVNNANAEIAAMQNVNRVALTVGALAAIADHVSGIPGRKNLVWISGGFPIQIGLPNIGVPPAVISTPSPRPGAPGVSMTGPGGGVGDTGTANRLPRSGQQTGSLEGQVRAAAESLNRANIAIYAIDAKGVEIDSRMDVSTRGPRLSSPVRGISALAAEQDARDSSKLLADRTGGLAFFGNNDIRDAMRRAFDDGRYAYSIGFYPNHGDWNGKFRKIKIQIKGEGLKLRYRSGYYAFSDHSDPQTVVVAALQEAADSPLDATNVGMIVSGKAAGKPDAPTLELHIGIDPKQLLLQDSDDHRTGAVDLLVLQSDADGRKVAAEKQHIALNLEAKQYEYMSKAAMVFDRPLLIAPTATEVRVVLRDAGSGSLGSVTFSIAGLLQNSAKLPVPAQQGADPIPSQSRH